MLKNKTEKEKAYFFLLIGITAMASASLIIKLTSAPPLVIASYRLLFASIFLLIINYKNLTIPKNKFTLLFAGISLGIHFYSWITALFLTSVANAVVLVNTSPIFISILTYIFEKKKPTKSFFLSFILVLLGVILITINQLSLKFEKGELLSIVGAITFAVYLYIGRYLSKSISVTSYITLVYLIAGVSLFLITFIRRIPITGYAPKTYLNFLLLAIIPQLIGHSSANYAIRILPPTSTSIILIGETVIATIFAFFFLKESLFISQIIGMLIIILGIFYSSLEKYS